MNGLELVLAVLVASSPAAQSQPQPPASNLQAAKAGSNETRPQTVAPPRQQQQQDGPRKGLTWAKGAQNDQLHTVFVSCHAQPRPEGAETCNPHVGDTPCTERRSVLCLKPDGSPRPPYPVGGAAHAMPKEFYQGWAGGQLGVTKPVAGTELTSVAAADALCEQDLGRGYRMAEFHDGYYFEGMGDPGANGVTWPKDRLRQGGWAFHAYGQVPDGVRFWVYINDQRAHCWDAAAPQAAPDRPATNF